MQEPRLLEKDIQRAIIEMLKKRPCSFTVKLAAGPYSLPGLPDVLHIDRGRPFFIEVKRPGGRPTPLQTKVMDKLLAAGAIVGIATSVEAAQEIIAREGQEGE